MDILFKLRQNITVYIVDDSPLHKNHCYYIRNLLSLSPGSFVGELFKDLPWRIALAD